MRCTIRFARLFVSLSTLLAAATTRTANASGPTHGQAPDLSSPESTVRSFAAALSRRDARSAGACVLGAVSPHELDDLSGHLGKGQYTLANIRTALDGNQATVTADTTWRSEETHKTDRGPETLHLKRVDSVWKIVPSDKVAFNSSGPQLAAMASLMAHPESLVASVYKNFEQRKACGLNIYEVSSAVRKAARNHHGMLTLTTATMQQALMPLR